MHKRNKRIGPILITIGVVLFGLMMVGFMTWASTEEPIPLPLYLYFVLPMFAVIIGIVLALRERLSEIEKGEDDVAAKY
ncbi:MAG TPA: hypothetical protein DIC19_06030 [Erysipelotrichaceae bacterium]|nr:hypothetical protein [Erysipelotrichaceae bacterium]